MSKNRNKKPRKPGGKSTRSGFGSTELIQLMKCQSDIKKLLDVVNDINAYRQNETQFLTDMMFSVNGLTLALTEVKVLRLLVAELSEKLQLTDEDFITLGQLKQLFANIPLIGSPQILSAKALVRKQYIDARKPFRPFTYDGITLEAQEWAKKLEMTYPELDVYLESGKTLEEIIKHLGKEELVEDLSPEEEKVIKDAVQTAIDRAHIVQSETDVTAPPGAGVIIPIEDNSPIVRPPHVEENPGVIVLSDPQVKDFDSMTEAEMEAALLAEGQ